MAKRNLLSLTQSILSTMESDEVNSIGDSTESLQVAEVIRDTYYDMHSNRNWPMQHKLVSLVPFSDASLPTHMRVAEDFTELDPIIYYDKRKVNDTRKKYAEVHWKEPDDFLRLTNPRNTDEDKNTVVTDPSGVELIIQNDKAPTYYTSFDDNTIVFDSYDSEVDDTLQESKIQAMAYTFPEFKLVDTFVPVMPIEAFSALLAEARSRCQFWFKDNQDIKSEQEAGRQQRWLSRKAWTVSGGIKFPDYGRKSAKGATSKEPTFRQRHIRDT